MTRLAHSDRRLLRRIDEVLHYLWDPIGVRGVPRARDEYESYVPGVFALLGSDAGEEELAAHLVDVAASLGLEPSVERARESASVLLEWRDLLNDR